MIGENKMNKTKIFGLIIMIFAVASFSYGYYLTGIKIKEEQIEDVFGGQSFGVELQVQVERDGEIVDSFIKNDDLVLDNFVNITMAMFRGDDSHDIYFQRTTGALTIFGGTTYFGGENARIQIGTGTTPPDYDDYELVNGLTTEVVEQISYSESGNQMNITAVATWNIDNTYAITEYALRGDVGYTCLVFRDVADAVNVIDGDILTVKYVIQLN